MQVQTALSAHTEPQGENAGALRGDRAMEMPAQHSQCQSFSGLLGNPPTPGQGELEVLSPPCLREGAAGVGEAQVRLRCLCTSSEHELRTALPLFGLVLG